MKVYFTKIPSYSKTKQINQACKTHLKTLNPKLEKEVPIKVHFGEKGNTTFIEPKNYQGIIQFLKNSYYIETNALYRGERTTKDKHLKLAKAHGFTNLPIIIADGDHGEDFNEIKINKTHFKTCKIGKEFSKYKQIIVTAHFKGHIVAGFGGAIKQLAMGCASRGGKLAQHSNSKPIINPLACKKCKTCLKYCPANAITIGTISKINHKKCIGCASCIAVCPYRAVKVNWLGASTPKIFHEKLAEYAIAAHKEKNIYINFVFNITKLCDCADKPMKPYLKDLGVLTSKDPVALDKACIDLLEKREKKNLFRGKHTLDYAEKIGLGKKEYELIEI